MLLVLFDMAVGVVQMLCIGDTYTTYHPYYLLNTNFILGPRYGTTKEQFAKVAEKNHRHSVNNPYAQFQDVYTLEEILGAKEICQPLTVCVYLLFVCL